jgi:hypothetical protein
LTLCSTGSRNPMKAVINLSSGGLRKLVIDVHIGTIKIGVMSERDP